MARSMSSGKKVSRPAQGVNSRRAGGLDKPKLSPTHPATVRQVSRGKLSAPKALPKWSPAAYPTPRVVANK